MLYTTTDAHGEPALASAIVMRLGAQPAPLGHPTVLWTHGTTGVQPGCAPSVLSEPFVNVPALAGALEKGWAIVAPDYMGQGTTGPHPYLIGEGQARSALDALRAAGQLPPVKLAAPAVVWGHSQGGHAALWTGILAPTYAPELRIAGVAAAAPATDLLPLIDRVQHTLVGRIMTAYVLHAYSAVYADVSFEAYPRSHWARLLAQDMASRCLASPAALFSIGEAALLSGSLFGLPPTEGPLAAQLAANTPDRALPQPVLVAQGLADDLVLPEVQSRWVQRRCAQGQAIEYRPYDGLDHLSLVAPESRFSADLIAWTQARFAGEPHRANCPG